MLPFNEQNAASSQKTLDALTDRIATISTRLHVSDFDGVLVGVQNDALNTAIRNDRQTIINDYAAKVRTVILTGRKHAWEAPEMLAGHSVSLERPDMTALLASLPPVLAEMTYLHNMGKDRTVHSITDSVPGTRSARMQHIDTVGELFKAMQKQILNNKSAPAVLQDILGHLNVTPQDTLLNIYIAQLPKPYWPAVVPALQEMLEEADSAATSAGAVVNKFLQKIAQDHGVQNIEFFQAAANEIPSMAVRQGDALPVFQDDDQTYIQLGTGTKGANLIYWLGHADLLQAGQDIILVADNFQTGGSDRELARDMIAKYGVRIHLWQSLDGKDKQELSADDPLRANLEFVFADMTAGYHFLAAVTNKSPSAVARLLLDGAIPGVRLPKPVTASTPVPRLPELT